jgi:hypothetical protein
MTNANKFKKDEDGASPGASARRKVCQEQLRQALDKTAMADTKIEVRGKWVASAHKCVLSARSAVFAGMFENETAEKHDGVVKLNDVTTEGLLAFLELIYLGTLSRSSLLC